MTSKAAKRRARKDRSRMISLPGADPVESRATGRDRRHTNQPEDPSMTALQSRCRRDGVKPTDEAIREMRAQWHGCNAGRAMASVTPPAERQDMWDAIQHMRRVVTAYDASLGAPRRHAVCLRLLVPSEPLEADAATPPLDDRSDADKQRQAVSAWMMMFGWLNWTDKAAAREALRVVVDDERCRDADGLVTALRCVSDGIKGNRMIYRGRDTRRG